MKSGSAVRRIGIGRQGRQWKEVRQLIQSIKGNSRSDLRAKAAKPLLSVYPLHSGEVGALLLEDVDWVKKTLTVQLLLKSKRVKDRISKRIINHAVANSWWDPKSLPSWLTEECYVQRIQPLLRGKKVREIADAMHVSHPYAALVRSGRRRLHPRHWAALAELVSPI